MWSFDLWAFQSDLVTPWRVLGAVSVYFPIEFESVDDGVRSIDEKWRNDIDLEFQCILDGVRKPYLTVTGSPMQRLEQILKFIDV